jgi:SAM-dependent methyltransferase
VSIPGPGGAKDLVRRGYDLVSHAYRADDFDYEASAYKACLEWILPGLSPDAHVLDLGCGCGIPVAKVLAETCRVTGVDISPVQVERARSLVPEATFLCQDFTSLEFAPGSFDAVTAFYSIIHLPIEEQLPFFERVALWLKPGGVLLCTVGWRPWTGIEEDWRGVPGATMAWSHMGRETYLEWLSRAGLTVEREAFLPEGEGGHTALLARSNSDRGNSATGAKASI